MRLDLAVRAAGEPAGQGEPKSCAATVKASPASAPTVTTAAVSASGCGRSLTSSIWPMVRGRSLLAPGDCSSYRVALANFFPPQ